MRRARVGSGLSEKDGRSEVWDAIDECVSDRYRETHLNYVSPRESGIDLTGHLLNETYVSQTQYSAHMYIDDGLLTIRYRANKLA